VAAVEKARAGCNVLCIANTVATAQEWFRKLKCEMLSDEFPVGLLHAKFTAHDRDRIEGDWMAKLGKPQKELSHLRPHGSILVSTQIVEQSVDIDADWMLSEIAPVDMLLQRLGRLWRHERLNRPVAKPELAIVCAKMPVDDLSGLPSETKELEEFFGRGVWVYAPYVLLRTLEILRGRRSIRVPNDIRALLEAVYTKSVPDTDLHYALLNDMREKAARLHRLAIMGQSDALPTKNDDEESAGTRYNSRPSVSLLIARSVDVVTGQVVLLDGTKVTISRFERNFKVTKALYRNLVQVAPNDTLCTVEGKTRELLSRHFFASDMPRICTWDAMSGVLRLFMTDEFSGYTYHPDYGAYRSHDANQVDSLETAVQEVYSSDVDLTTMSDSDNVSASEPEGEFIFDNGKDW
jgi:CRISPR-associated endonuclease/helicase Cas3